jgi:hypothetical protein
MAWVYDDESPTPELIKKACDHESICEKNPYTAQIRNLKQERDEAREDASHWKIEYEIVEARLCGGKHERDNGIVSEREIIPKLQRERDEAIRQFENIQASSIHTCHDQCQRPMCVLRRERDEARKHLKEIEEYGTEEINAAIDLRRNLAQALVDLDDMQYQRDEAREQNTKLREIAERAINYLDQSYRDGFSDEASDLRYELNQLKKEDAERPHCSADPFRKWKWMMDYCKCKGMSPTLGWGSAEEAFLRTLGKWEDAK